jgi:fatty acid desaturase
MVMNANADNAADAAAAGPTPGEAFADQDHAKLRLAPKVVRRLTTLSDARGAAAVLLNVLGAAAGVVPALIEVNIWTVLWAFMAVPAAAHGFAILSHEAVHYRLFSARWLNDVVGRCCGLLIGVSMCTYRIVHRLHHNHLYDRDLDPDLALMAGYPRGKYYLLKKLAIDMTGLTAYKNYSYFMGRPAKNAETNQRVKPLDDTSPRLRRQARYDRYLILLFHGAMVAGAGASGLWLEYLLLWFLPLITVFQVILRLRAVLEHGAVGDLSSPLTAARTNLAPAGLSWLIFPHHVNYHIEHHLYPSVPHYNLAACHQAFADAGMLDGAEVTTVPQALRKIMADRLPKGAVSTG